MRIRSLCASEWALVPQELRALLARAGARAGRPDGSQGPPWLEICDTDLRVLAAVRLRDATCLQAIEQQAAALDYRSLRLASPGAGGPPRALLVRNRAPAHAVQRDASGLAMSAARASGESVRGSADG
jgi:hypothetical protein